MLFVVIVEVDASVANISHVEESGRKLQTLVTRNTDLTPSEAEHAAAVVRNITEVISKHQYQVGVKKSSLCCRQKNCFLIREI